MVVSCSDLASHAIVDQIILKLHSAMLGGRSQAHTLSYPLGWASLEHEGSLHPSLRNFKQRRRTELSCEEIVGCLSPGRDAEKPQQPSCGLIIHDLASLVLVEGTHKVAQLIQRLKWDPGVSCILLSIQEDVVPRTFMAQLETLASCVLRLTLPDAAIAASLQAAVGFNTAGILHLTQARRTGRVRTQLQILKQLPGQELQAVPWPAGVDPANPAAAGMAAALQAVLLSSPSEPVPEAGRGDSHARQESAAIQAGMRFSVTSQERAARDEVVLPHAYHSQKMAESAQPMGIAAQDDSQYGHIDYVRDSETDPDSDEDPDDDLDF
ncbi:hypothetical protein WJX73_010682 [Symbiochloris irregularis]|uniref:Elongator complex protein 5 n=1 Tax=Symbiochloris irregularis TaxID=706552 RepID=A0AAW1PJR8_9CHLO